MWLERVPLSHFRPSKCLFKNHAAQYPDINNISSRCLPTRRIRHVQLPKVHKPASTTHPPCPTLGSQKQFGYLWAEKETYSGVSSLLGSHLHWDDNQLLQQDSWHTFACLSLEEFEPYPTGSCISPDFPTSLALRLNISSVLTKAKSLLNLGCSPMHSFATLRVLRLKIYHNSTGSSKVPSTLNQFKTQEHMPDLSAYQDEGQSWCIWSFL